MVPRDKVAHRLVVFCLFLFFFPLLLYHDFLRPTYTLYAPFCRNSYQGWPPPTALNAVAFGSRIFLQRLLLSSARELASTCAHTHPQLSAIYEKAPITQYKNPNLRRPAYQTAGCCERCVTDAVLVIRQYMQHALKNVITHTTTNFPTVGTKTRNKMSVNGTRYKIVHYVQTMCARFFFVFGVCQKSTLRRSWTESGPRLGTPRRRMLTLVGANSRRSLTIGCSTGRTLSRPTA